MSLLKISAIALASAIIATGCASHRTNQDVKVASGVAGYTGSVYQGGSLVNNSDAIKAAAANLQGVVRFGFDSDAISAQAAAILDEQVAFLQANPSARVLVAGHTDERGSREYNISLGERRAAAVRSYLTQKGVNTANIEIVSFGEERPVAAGSTEEAWSQNRRAELSY
ncbi:peptidoglycan-associated lipoprotein [Moraxella caviae]|uniref:Peptidoglycan-associated lipoprotein n=1 Tax=Moraxella caviae TaxID=34060 RepID=A0A1T0AB49_9GAMM|nr:peptidoglycan-associated lipoprotein Pal [Moraxella caviae]OOR92956.1 peptidoglycan-associated lipoprotein [Moraxella caviae]STZ10085.1 15 kDa peptidoglycan-associated lipoprotein [Moraxella caviae]